MSKTIGRKICGLVAVIGVVMILMVVLNIAALGVLKGYSAEVKDNVVTLEKAVQSGDAGEKAEIDAVFEEWVRKNTVKINGTLIFDVKSRDEIGRLVGGFNNFIEQLQGVVRTIKEQSIKLLESSQNVKEQIETSNESAVNVSASMEELSASMEEVAATIEQIASGTGKILERVRDVSEEAEEGAGMVEEIKKNSNDMYNKAVNSKE